MKQIQVSMLTIFKVVGTGLGLWAVLLLWPAFLLFLVSVVLAVTLHPTILWMEGGGCRAAWAWSSWRRSWSGSW